MKKKILITGVSGFIGYSLAENLLKKNKYSVVGIDSMNNYYDPKLKKARLKNLKNSYKKKFVFYKCNIANKISLKKIFQKHKFDIVINLAAQAGVRYSIENPDAYIESNLLGFFNILNFSKMHKVSHFLYASTSSVYGSNKKLPFSDDMLLLAWKYCKMHNNHLQMLKIIDKVVGNALSHKNPSKSRDHVWYVE